MQTDKRFWETSEVDLNLRHYSGHPSDAIKLVKRNIEKYLRKPGVPQKDREVYSAMYHALDYYKSILYSSASDFSTALIGDFILPFIVMTGNSVGSSELYFCARKS